MQIEFHALDAETVAAIRAGGPDAYGAPPERTVSDGGGNPCRHCLRDVPEGAQMLILAYRPFPALQPYAETGPIFLCADCAPAAPSPALPAVVASRREFLVKAYGHDDRIRYGTGKITAVSELAAYCESLLEDPATAYVDLRSAANNCFICRAKRAE